MIRRLDQSDFEIIYRVINEAARLYKGVIPAECWKEPYMPGEELLHEIGEGVEFWGYEESGEVAGVMGIQRVGDVALIRHAYVRSARQNRGIGSALLSHLKASTTHPILVGTWEKAYWAVRFYEKHGFRLVSEEEKKTLLRKYWSVPQHQIENSVVLADQRWFESRRA